MLQVSTTTKETVAGPARARQRPAATLPLIKPALHTLIDVADNATSAIMAQLLAWPQPPANRATACSAGAIDRHPQSGQLAS